MDENLKSLNKLKSDIKNVKLISLFLPKAQRKEIKEMETKLNHMVKVIGLFNQYFSDAGWCSYDSMNMELMEKSVKAYETGGIEDGEKVLIEYYKNDVKEFIHWLKNKARPFMERHSLIQQAFDEHFSGRYYVSVLLFLIIVDGSVNDYTRSKGFFSEGTDVSAWDCIVGSSESLEKLKRIFNERRNKTNSDEIRMPYRNGILHGRDLNYGNEYVSCKCVALMFGLADWMNMKDTEDLRKQKFKKELNPPLIFESIKKIQQNAVVSKEIENWIKREVIIGRDLPSVPNEDDCREFPYVIPLLRAFEAWREENYGRLSIYFRNIFNYEKSEKKRAGECRALFASKRFTSFKIKEIEERGCTLSRILVEVKWKDASKDISEVFEFGSNYQGEDDKIALPWRENGEWVLIPWRIQGLYK